MSADKNQTTAGRPSSLHVDVEAYGWAIAAVAVATGIAFLARDILPVASLSMFYLVSVLLVAARFGTWPSLFASIVAFLAYNFVHTEPYFSFRVADTEVVFTLVLFLFVAVLTGNAAARLRVRVETERALGAERDRVSAEIAESRLVAERERLRSALLSSVSHDLRTPLVSIIGAATSLLETPDAIGPEANHQLLETIRDEGERLNRYVQNLLDMTRISHGALELRPEWIDLRELIGGATRQLRAELSRHRLHISAASDLPAASGDPLLLQQVLVNVLDNASKHAPPGSTIEIVAAASDPHAIDIAVTDAGPGIPAADRERIFDMFFRVTSGDSRGTGTGLGLAIARGIMAAHGGTIQAMPGPDGRGTTIAIKLPAIADQAAEIEREGP